MKKIYIYFSILRKKNNQKNLIGLKVQSKQSRLGSNLGALLLVVTILCYMRNTTLRNLYSVLGYSVDKLS